MNQPASTNAIVQLRNPEGTQDGLCTEVDKAGHNQTKEEQEPVSSGVDSALAEGIQSTNSKNGAVTIKSKTHLTHVSAK